jgi:hypothetical protein
MKAEVGDHLMLAGAFAAVVVLFWFFLSPGIKNR